MSSLEEGLRRDGGKRGSPEGLRVPRCRSDNQPREPDVHYGATAREPTGTPLPPVRDVHSIAPTDPVQAWPSIRVESAPRAQSDDEGRGAIRLHCHTRGHPPIRANIPGLSFRAMVAEFATAPLRSGRYLPVPPRRLLPRSFPERRSAARFPGAPVPAPGDPTRAARSSTRG